MGVGAFPGYAFGVLGPHLVSDFSLSRAELGLLTTMHFVVAGISSLMVGSLVDRLGGRRMLAAATALLGLAVAGMAIAPSFGWLVVMGAAAGVPLSANNPATNKLVAVHVPPGRRGITMGVKQAGVQVSAFLTGAVLPRAAAVWGWRTALAASIVVPGLGLLAALWLPRDHTDARPGRRGRRGPPREPLTRAVRTLAAYAFLMGAGVAAVNAYLPLFAVERLSLSPTTAGTLFALIGLTGVISRVSWGWRSERLSSFAVPLGVMGAGAAVAIGLFVAAQALPLAVVWVGAILFGATAVSWNAVGMLAILRTASAEDTGRASGVVLFGFYGGFVSSPILFGAIVDTTGSYVPAWSLVLTVFAAACGLMFRVVAQQR